jgi:hypothetical protein
VTGVWRTEPAAVIGAVRAVLVAAVGFGLDLSGEQITGLILALEAVAVLITRRSVVAPSTLVDAARKSAELAATVVAEDLAPETVGVAGTVSGVGHDVAITAAALAANDVLRDLGVGRKDRAA